VPAAPAVLHLVRALRGHAFGTVVIAYSAAFSACENSPAAPAGLTALASDAAPCQRAGCVCLRCRHQRGRKVPAAPAGPHLSRAMWRHAIVPHVGGLAVRASHRQMARGRVSPRRKTPAVRARVVAHRGRGGLAESSVAPSNDPFRLARRRVLHCLRARPRHASAPDVFAYSAASSACRRYQQHQQAFISHVRWGAMPPCRLCSLTVPPSARAESAAAPAGLRLLRALRCRVIAPDGITYSAAICACDKSQPH